MKKILLATLFLFYTASCLFSQNFYYPNGKRIPDKYHSINQIDSMLGIFHVHILFCKKIGETVGFKMLTNKPVWVQTNDPKRIPILIKQFNYKEYLHSWEFGFDLDEMIKDRSLYDIYLLKAIGAPNDRTKASNGTNSVEIWTYNSLHYKFTFVDGYVVSYIKW